MYKIGQIITFKEDKKIKTTIKGIEKTIKKGDKGFFNCAGIIKIITGEANGNILITKEDIKGYETEDITDLIFNKLKHEFSIEDMLEDYEIEEEDFKEVIMDMLDEIF